VPALAVNPSLFFTEENGKLARDLVEILEGANQQVPAELKTMSYSSRGGKGGRGGKGYGKGGKGYGKGGGYRSAPYGGGKGYGRY